MNQHADSTAMLATVKPATVHSLTYAEMPPELMSVRSYRSENVLSPAVRAIITFARATVADNAMKCDEIDRILSGQIETSRPDSRSITGVVPDPTGYQGTACHAGAIGPVLRGDDGPSSTI
ncbi:hypothetical protein ABZS52_11700 [Micromonospora profundi]|uniref:hypothetical protein n=1 Tax=Micromonospora profundi TaxID=1420889 RepID=UPI0033BEAF80